MKATATEKEKSKDEDLVVLFEFPKPIKAIGRFLMYEKDGVRVFPWFKIFFGAVAYFLYILPKNPISLAEMTVFVLLDIGFFGATYPIRHYFFKKKAQ